MDHQKFARGGDNGFRKKGSKCLDIADQLERIALSAQHLRLASMNLMIADEVTLAERLDEFIDQVDRISIRRCS